MTFPLLALVLLLAPADASGHVADDESATITLRTTSEGPQRFEVVGVPEDRLATLRTLGPTESAWRELFLVSVGIRDEEARQPLLGRYGITGDCIWFQPRFPLEPGQKYVAELRLGEHIVRREFGLAAGPVSEPTTIVQVYPTANVVPENLLKLYLHFSAPMSRGDVYRHIRLLDSTGTAVEDPFLELGEELWNGDGTRLTVFFDPGRIKRELKPRREVGPVLEENKSYTLVIDRDWQDAEGRPLEAEFRRGFTVGSPDDVSPDPQRWRLTAPRAGTREPLVLHFDEPLDHAMLGRVLVVQRGDRSAVAGQIRIDRHETRWRFVPTELWSAGLHRLVIETTLEDLAGNSIARPFEVDIVRPIETTVVNETTELPFEVVPTSH